MRLIAALISLGVLNPFAPPLAYGPGHRGVDFAAQAGQLVVAPVSGRVTFVGEVAGVGTVTIAYDSYKVTLQPIHSPLAKGSTVIRGQEIGRVARTKYHCTQCLHIGLRQSGRYLNPLSITRAQLLPIGRSAWVSNN